MASSSEASTWDSDSDTDSEESIGVAYANKYIEYMKNLDTLEEKIKEKRRTTRPYENRIWRMSLANKMIRTLICSMTLNSVRVDNCEDAYEWDARTDRINAMTELMAKNKTWNMKELAGKCGAKEIRKRLRRIDVDDDTHGNRRTIRGMYYQKLRRDMMRMMVELSRYGHRAMSNFEEEWKGARDAIAEPWIIARGKLREPHSIMEKIESFKQKRREEEIV